MLNAECQDLRDTRAGNTGSNHGIDIRERQPAGCFDGHDFPPAMEFPLEGFSPLGVDVLDAVVLGEFLRLLGSSVLFEIGRRCHGQHTAFEQPPRRHA
jgi:hypothetical protein